MKTGLTIQQMAQELLRQSKAKQDYLVNTGSLSLSVTSDAPQLRVTENGLDKITPLDIRQTAHRQLGTYLGIPQKYYELMRTDAPELLAYNANYWFSQKNELRTLRTMDGCARAFLSNRYRRIDNLDIASVTLPVIGELPEARFVSTQITDDFMYIKVVNPRLQADVVPGDVVQAGVIISNSETGLGSVKVECYPNTPAIKVQLLPVNAGERITMTQNLGQPLPRYQAFLCDGMLEVDSTAFMDYMEENDLGYIVDYKRYDADVFTGVNRRTAAVFQFHSAALRRLNKVGCQRYEGDYTRLKQKHAERRARRMAG